MTELELCQLSQRALMSKLRKVTALSQSRLRRLRKAEARIEELEQEVENLNYDMRDMQDRYDMMAADSDDA